MFILVITTHLFAITVSDIQMRMKASNAIEIRNAGLAEISFELK
jgi:hypothetical protein